MRLSTIASVVAASLLAAGCSSYPTSLGLRDPSVRLTARGLGPAIVENVRYKGACAIEVTDAAEDLDARLVTSCVGDPRYDAAVIAQLRRVSDPVTPTFKTSVATASFESMLKDPLVVPRRSDVVRLAFAPRVAPPSVAAVIAAEPSSVETPVVALATEPHAEPAALPAHPTVAAVAAEAAQEVALADAQRGVQILREEASRADAHAAQSQQDLAAARSSAEVSFARITNQSESLAAATAEAESLRAQTEASRLAAAQAAADLQAANEARMQADLEAEQVRREAEAARLVAAEVEAERVRVEAKQAEDRAAAESARTLAAEAKAKAAADLAAAEALRQETERTRQQVAADAARFFAEAEANRLAQQQAAADREAAARKLQAEQAALQQARLDATRKRFTDLPSTKRAEALGAALLGELPYGFVVSPVTDDRRHPQLWGDKVVRAVKQFSFPGVGVAAVEYEIVAIRPTALDTAAFVETGFAIDPMAAVADKVELVPNQTRARLVLVERIPS